MTTMDYLNSHHNIESQQQRQQQEDHDDVVSVLPGAVVAAVTKSRTSLSTMMKTMLVLTMIMISFISSPVTTAQTTLPSTTTIVQMRRKNFFPYGILFQFPKNTETNNSTLINITDIINDSPDTCYDEFIMIRNKLYTTYTGSLLVETPLTTVTLQSLDNALLNSPVFNSIAAVVDGTSNQNFIIVQQQVLPLNTTSNDTTSGGDGGESPDNDMSSSTPSIAPSSTPSADNDIIIKSSSELSPTVAPSVLPSITPSSEPSVTPSLKPTITPTITPSIGPSVGPSSESPIISGRRTRNLQDTDTTEENLSPTSSAPSSTPTQVPTVKRVVIDEGIIVSTATSIPVEFLQTDDIDDLYHVDDDWNNDNTFTVENPTLIIEVVIPPPTPAPIIIFTASAPMPISIVVDVNPTTPPPALSPSSIYNVVDDTNPGARQLLNKATTTTAAALNEEGIIVDNDDNDNEQEEEEIIVDSVITESDDQRRLQKICRRSICFQTRFVIDVFGCRTFCRNIGDDRRQLLTETTMADNTIISHGNNRDLQQRNNRRRKRSNNKLYKKGKRNAVIRGRGEVTAALFYQYVEQFININNPCHSTLLSMTYIIIDLEIQ